MSHLLQIINMQCTAGQPHKGVALSNTQLIHLLPNELHKRIDIQKIPQPMFENNPIEVLKKCIESQQKLPRTLFFGGDHYASFFTILSSLAVHGNNFRLIWLDAHGDIHNMKTSPSGNKHGMPVRLLMEHTIPGIPQLQPYQILYVGVRDLERAEWNYIHRRKIQYIRAADVDSVSTMQSIAKFVRGHKVHISLDVDVLDPAVMPCTGTLAAGGLRLETLLAAYETIIHRGNLIKMDIMEYNPKLGTAAEKKVAKRTMRTILQKIIDF